MQLPYVLYARVVEFVDEFVVLSKASLESCLRSPELRAALIPRLRTKALVHAVKSRHVTLRTVLRRLEQLNPKWDSHSTDLAVILTENATFLHRMTDLCAPPAALRAFLEREETSSDLESLRRAIASGDERAIAALGTMYEQGIGVARDLREAVKLYKRSNSPEALNSLGYFYEQGRGNLRRDDVEAARLFKLASDKGFAAAQCNLGYFYEQGRGGLGRNEHEAVRLYTLSADQGYEVAQYTLGWCYAKGLGGLPRDKVAATRLMLLAADQGHAGARRLLTNGFFY